MDKVELIDFKKKMYSGLSSPLMGSLSENIESKGFSDYAPAGWTARCTFLFPESYSLAETRQPALYLAILKLSIFGMGESR